MNVQDCEQLTLFREDSLASPFPWLETKKEKKTTVTYGRKCSGLSENLARVGYLVRTYLESCELPGEQFVRTWSVRDTLSPYLILKLRLSEQNTGGKGCSLSGSALWKMPVTADANNREFYRNSRGEPNLSAQVKVAPCGPPPKCQQMWPTPTTRDYKDGSAESCKNVPVNGLLGRAIHMFPTPRAQSATGASNTETRQGAPDLQTVAGGQLNPNWVEWLMGFPIGFTDIGE